MGRQHERIGDSNAQKKLRGGLTDEEIKRIEESERIQEEMRTKDCNGKGKGGRDPRKAPSTRRTFTEKEYAELKRRGLI